MRTATLHRKRVVTIRKDSTVYAAASLMNHQAVGCLVVIDLDESPVGIITDRDLTLRAVAESHDPAAMRIEDIMSRDLVHASISDPLDKILQRMKHRGVRRIPLLEDNRVVGLVSLDDILQEFSRDLHDLASEAPRRYRNAPSHSRFDHMRHGLDRNLFELRSRLEYAHWYAREAFLEELDELRDRLRNDTDKPQGA